ncbi:hypothetical protein [Granulicella mallensis]|uniref:Uncharacterized protein n=1 Tax=Granulicella mallensis TaxID=940614 RepID=A0A7W7ZUU1_9BACT|nr:hypothetical protein [Granulicella mallensis]MBB5066133.1 hypothetical protein [Granulicella mallensis]
MSNMISESAFFAEKPTEEKSTDEQAPTKEAVLKASEDFHAIPLSMVADADKPTEEKAPEKLNPALTGQDMLQPKRQTFVKPNEDLAALDAL